MMNKKNKFKLTNDSNFKIKLKRLVEKNLEKYNENKNK